MKKFNSAAHAACLSAILPLDDNHFQNRSDEWWDRFWFYMHKDLIRQLEIERLV